jgi:hypothetical protein
MSSSVPTPSPADDASNQSPEVPLVNRSSRSSARTHPTSDAAPSVLRLEYPHQQRSCFMVADEKVLRHNYDILASNSLHFSEKSTRMIDGHGDICVYKHMFLARVHLSFPPIFRGVAFLLGDYVWAINAQRLDVFLLYILIVAYSVPERDYVSSKVFKHLWTPCLSQL